MAHGYVTRGIMLQQCNALAVFVLLILAHKLHEGASSIISQSSISTCEAGNDKEPSKATGGLCEKKIIVSMALSGGQVNDNNYRCHQ